MAGSVVEAPSVRRAEPSPQERETAGKAVRGRCPRSSHGEWAPATDRADPITLLQSQEAGRVEELIPIRYGRMLASPFAFFRGAAAVMAADLAAMPSTGQVVQLCGDAHLSNFGGFAGPDRHLLFDVNDFDETLPGPWEWDVKRLAASLEIAGRERMLSREERSELVRGAARAYGRSIRAFADMANLDVWYARLDATDIHARLERDKDRYDLGELDRIVTKARSKDSHRALSKLTHEVDGEPRIVSQPPLIVPLEDVFGVDAAAAHDVMQDLLLGYRETLPDSRRHLFDRYRYVHAARKVVGVGSVGNRAWIVLLLGRDESDPLFLQVKQAGPSVLAEHLEPSAYEHQGRRVVEGQRLMQAASDISLGWLTASDPDGARREFYVRQLWDQKASVRLERMSPAGVDAYARACAWTLARAHARSGDRIAIGAYLGSGKSFERAMSSFAEAYADQNERDYAALQAAVDEGRVDARSEP